METNVLRTGANFFFLLPLPAVMEQEFSGRKLFSCKIKFPQSISYAAHNVCVILATGIAYLLLPNTFLWYDCFQLMTTKLCNNFDWKRLCWAYFSGLDFYFFNKKKTRYLSEIKTGEKTNELFPSF